MTKSNDDYICEKKKVSLDNLLEYIGVGKFTNKLIAIIGSLYIIDGSQLTILAIMAPFARCNWHLKESGELTYQISSVVGTGLGHLYWGWLSDRIGRKLVAIMCSVLVLYFGLLTVFTYNYVWFLMLCGIVGFGAGGMICAPCYISEITTAKYRGKVVVGAMLFFVFGSAFTAVIALLTSKYYGWRYLVVFTSIPIPFFIVMYLWLPESIPYLRNTANYDTLMKVMVKLGVQNKKPFLLGDIEIDCRPSNKRGKISRLFKRKYLLKTIVMCIMSLTGYFCYAGAILQHSYFLRLHKTEGYDVLVMDTPTHERLVCHTLSNNDCLQFLLACLAEGVLVCLMIPIIDFVGRKRMVVVLLLINITCYFGIIYISVHSKSLTTPLTILLLILRSSSIGIVAINLLFGTELFPTVVRGSALGICSFSNRIGIILAAVMVTVLYPISIVSVIMIFVGLCVLCTLITTLLPDTTGQLLLNK